MEITKYPKLRLFEITSSQKNLKRAFDGKRKLNPLHSIIIHVRAELSDTKVVYYEYTKSVFNGSSMQLRCTQDTQHKNTQCKARLNLKYGNIKVKKYGKQWDFDADMDYKYEYITNASNWGEVYHNCSKYCESKCGRSCTNLSCMGCSPEKQNQSDIYS